MLSYDIQVRVECLVNIGRENAFWDRKGDDFVPKIEQKNFQGVHFAPSLEVEDSTTIAYHYH